QFQLIEGTERKSTGSYYTPKALIDILIRTTLQSLVEDRLIEAGDDGYERESAILDLKVCDPACGGGTFLLSALDYLGKKLAEVRNRTDSPLEDDLRKARREVLQHCIYGVDMNPLAVELAKISLWLRACVKDKPLNFLDNHIKCGNSLIGLGQKIEIDEINPNAFEAISGNKATGIPNENKKLRSRALEIIKKEIKERIKQGKPTLITSFFTESRTADICSAKFQEIVNLPENNLANINQKEILYEELKKNENYQQALNEANIWTSTFFWLFEGDSLGEIPRYTTIEQLRDKITDPELKNLMIKIQKIANDNQFFHWFIEFPEVFSSEREGFDCILTNPPWDVLEFKEIPFFTGLSNKIISAPNQSKRRELINDLKISNPSLFNYYTISWRRMKKFSHYINKSSLYNLSSKGKLNTYALFTERSWNLISPRGYTGIIAPTGIIMNYYMQDLFKSFVENRSIISIFDFSNRKKIFNIDSHFRFCLLTLGGKKINKEIIPMTFYTLFPEKIQEPLSLIYENKGKLKDVLDSLPDDHILIPLKRNDIELFNPNTLTCPSLKSKKDLELLRNLYKEGDIIIKRNNNEIINHLDIEFKVLFNISSDSELYKTENQLSALGAYPLEEESKGGIWVDSEGIKYYPLYSGKMIWQYDHRYQSEIIDTRRKQRSLKPIKNGLEEHRNTNFNTIPAYRVSEIHLNERLPYTNKFNWFLAFRDMVSVDNRRTFISTIIPKTATQDTIPLILSPIKAETYCLLLANLNSIVFDYMTRLKISGTHISFFILEQLPILKFDRFSKELIELIKNLVLELVYTSNDLKDFAIDLNYIGDPFIWDEHRRSIIQAQIDAINAILYNLTKDDLIYIIDSFDILRRKEIEKFNEFRTKSLILDAYDKFSEQKELFE
ncbi:hypothetical protein LCGC14_1744140, partial [marine sediment metagenome]